MASELLRFSSRLALERCLWKHPATHPKYNSDLTDRKIIEAVADAFANRETSREGVDMGVMLVMRECDLDPDRLPAAFVTIHLNLTQAVRDCSAGKPIKLEKKAHK